MSGQLLAARQDFHAPTAASLAGTMSRRFGRHAETNPAQSVELMLMPQRAAEEQQPRRN